MLYFSDVVAGQFRMMQEDTRGEPPYNQSLPNKYENAS